MKRRSPHFWSNVLAVAYKEAHRPAARQGVPRDRHRAADHDAAALRRRAVEQAGATCRGRCSTAATPALSRRLVEEIAGDRLLPAAGARSRATTRAARCSQRGEARRVPRHPDDFRRDVERGRPRVQLLLDGSDPLTAARVGGYVGAGRGAPSSPRAAGVAARARARTRRRGRIDVRQRFWFNPTLRDREFFLAGARRHAAHQPLPLGDAASASSASARAAPTSRCWRCRRRRSRSCSASSLPLRRRQLRRARLRASSPPGSCFGIWPRGSWLALLRRHPALRARLARHRRRSSRRSRAPRRRRSSSRSSSSCRRSCSRASMMPYQLMPHGVREIGGLLPLRWYQIALRRDHRARRRARRRRGADRWSLVVLFAVILLLLIRWRMKPRLA